MQQEIKSQENHYYIFKAIIKNNKRYSFLVTHTNQPEEKSQFQSSQTSWEALGNPSRISKDQYLSSFKKTNIEIFLLFPICEITTGLIEQSRK